MQMRKLGSSGPELSVIGFGAWEAGGTDWGPNESENGVLEAIRTALDAGISWIDTAEVYGAGVSETLVGKAVAGRREDVLLASKVAPEPDGSGFRPEQVRAACERSLRRLGTDRLDLYQLHWPDASGIPVEETWGAMVELAGAGTVGAIGVSNFDRSLIERCEAIRHVDSLQQELSMLALEDRDLVRWCGEAGTGVVTYGPLGFGLLTGALTREAAASAADWRTQDDDGPFVGDKLDHGFAILDGLRPIAARLGASPAQVALAWNWQQPGVTSAIAGSRSPGHVRDNAAAGDLLLDDDTIAELDALLA